jgi:CoA:oxalate CoA-transferase
VGSNVLPLEGIQVLALEQYYAGNVGSLMLARFGAQITKVEPPDAGDAMRQIGPQAHNASNETRCLSELRVMCGKKSIAIDMATAEGRDLIFKMVARSDVVWSNMKPSSLTKLGITYERLRAYKKDIVYTTLSGFGHDDLVPQGPFGNWVAFDIIAQGLAGLQFRVESDTDEPRYNGLALGDQVTAIHAAFGTVLALYRRARDGQPQRVDIAMHDAMLYLNELSLSLTAFTGKPPSRGRSGTSAPYGAFRSKNGFVNVAVGGTPVWKRFCVAIERPDLIDDARFKEARGRVKNNVELEEIVSAWTRQHTTEEIVRRLHTEQVPSAPVFTLPQVLESPQIAPRNMLLTVDDPIAGATRILGNPLKMSDVPDDPRASAPMLGEHTKDILLSIGLDEETIQALEKKGVIRIGSAPRGSKARSHAADAGRQSVMRRQVE